MDDRIISNEYQLFDELEYLRANPDVAASVAAGLFVTGWHHYNAHGRAEGRRCSNFDENFYLQSYPIAVEEISAGLVSDPREHFARFGKSRGYLSHPKALRPRNAAALTSSFGGLWPDLPNAFDIVRGRLNIGQITPRQADLCAFWIENGYVILREAVSGGLIDKAVIDLDNAFSGKMNELRFECGATGNHDPIAWRPELNIFPAKALDIHYFSPALRDLIFADAVTQFLGLIFDSKPFASQTLGFLRGSGQRGHQDSAYVTYTIPRHFAASWIALEDVAAGAGELFYYPSSHRFEDFIYSGEYKSAHEAMRMTGAPFPHQQDRDHLQSLEEKANARGLAKTTFLAKKGDALIWHADLVHGGNPVSSDITRKSVVTHYCPEHLSPLFAENVPTRLYRHNGYRYTSSYYLSLSPVL
jgi:hypothetical protein